MTIEQLLRRYNKGVLRGAQRRLARAIGVSESNLSQWLLGKTALGERLQEKAAAELGVPLEQLRAAIAAPAGSEKTNEIAELREQIADLNRRLASLVREMEVRYHLERGALEKKSRGPSAPRS